MFQREYVKTLESIRHETNLAIYRIQYAQSRYVEGHREIARLREAHAQLSELNKTLTDLYSAALQDAAPDETE